MSPFMADCGREMRSFPEEVSESRDAAPSAIRISREQAQRLVAHMKALHQQLHDELDILQSNRADRCDTAEAPAYRAGDLVWLDSRHITNRLRPSAKLDVKKRGPFRVIEPIGTSSPRSYRVDIPNSWKLSTNVFHVSLLSPAASDPLPEQQTSAPEPAHIDETGEKSWEISGILASRERKRGRGHQLQYLVDFAGYEPEWRPWYDLENGAEQAVADFHANHNRPGPWHGFIQLEALETPSSLAGFSEIVASAQSMKAKCHTYVEALDLPLQPVRAKVCSDSTL